MAINDNALLKVGSGNYFLGAAGASYPTDLANPGAGFENIGHTSIEEIMAFSSEGGEATVLGTLQAPSARTAYSPRSETMAINIHQFDEEGLKLYFGSNMVDINGDGSLLGVPTAAAPTLGSFLAVYWDGQNVFSYWAPRAEIFRGDDAELADTESLAALPLSITPLVQAPNTWAYAVSPIRPYVAPTP